MNTLTSEPTNPADQSLARSKTSAFRKPTDARGNAIVGLWERNGRYYLQISISGKVRRLSLRDELNHPVRSVPAAVAATAELRKKLRQGELPVSVRVPKFDDYRRHYISALQTLTAKKHKTIKCEESILNGWAGSIGDLGLNQVTPQHVTAYVTTRKSAGLNNRTVNLDALVLNNLLRFAREEGLLSGKLPTEGWEPLPYKAPRKELFTKADIEKICATAISLKADGAPKYKGGQLLADVLRFLRSSGARITSALATRWTDINFERRQSHLRQTKFDNHNIVVDFNAELEAHLRDMFARRQPDSEFVFPSTRGAGSAGSVRQTFNKVRVEAGMPKFGFHDCRHSFISFSIMSGIDPLVVAAWVGHSDGGVLIFKTYGHLNSEHRTSSAKKLRFEPGNQTAALVPSNLVDPIKLTTAELISLLQRSQQEAPQASVACSSE
jgi:integrase